MKLPQLPHPSPFTFWVLIFAIAVGLDHTNRRITALEQHVQNEKGE